MKSVIVVCGLLSVLFVCPALSAQKEETKQTATGYVFDDVNRNGVRQAGEAGIADVLVSNGEQLVRTDAEGRYEIEIGEDTQIFVIKPRNWQVPLSEDNLPLFHYTHKPEGSPDLKYAGLAPTGELPESVDFALRNTPEPDFFKVVIFGDPQPYSIQEVDWLSRDIVEELVGAEQIAFGMTMGDIVGNDLSLFDPINQVIGHIGVPWYYVLGNHDMNFDTKDDRLSDETYERVYGPPNFAFQYGPVHFIVFDDVIYPRNEDGGYVGGMRPDQIAFMENYIDQVPADELIVLNMHIPIVGRNGSHGNFRRDDQQAFFDMLQDHPHTLSISAHTHLQDHIYIGKDRGWKRDEPHHHYNVGTTSGSWWKGRYDELGVPHTMMRDGTPNGYAVIDFHGNDYSIFWKSARSPRDYQMNLHAPDAVRSGSDADVPLYANVFNGDESSRVEYRIGRIGEWREMKQVYENDPHYLRLHKLWSDNPDQPEGRKVPNPERSSHLWKGKVDTDLEPGTYLITVRATDVNGDMHTAYRTYRVTPSPAEAEGAGSSGG